MNRLDVVEQILDCTRCELAAQCGGPVPFTGPDHPRIAIVGEAPGEQEDRHGRPFVGPAGQLLAALLADAGITEPVAHLNTVSCFPHGTPTWDHIRACETNKTTQLDHLDPDYVLLVGRVALKATRADLDIKRGRGRPFAHQGRIHYATYHPAAALRKLAFEDSLRDDLIRFKQVVDAGDAWIEFIPDTCVECAVEPVWLEHSGIGWCAVHMPAEVRADYEARRQLLEADLEAARQRSHQVADLAPARTAFALEAVEAAADPDWMDIAWAALVTYLETHRTMFVDDLWDTGLPEPRESRALGPLILRAARDGLMAKSGEFRKSVRSHLTEKPVWRSLIYGRCAHA